MTTCSTILFLFLHWGHCFGLKRVGGTLIFLLAKAFSFLFFLFFFFASNAVMVASVFPSLFSSSFLPFVTVIS